MRRQQILTIATSAAILTGMAACSTSKPATAESTSSATATTAVAVASSTTKRGGPAMALPKALAYKMNGAWQDNVAVNLNASGTTIESYPAPTDLSESQRPIPLADGFWLDRRGISTHSRFTRYTWKEYESLSKAPTPQELMNAIIPEARVVEMVELPMTLETAVNDTAAVNAYLRSQIKRLPANGQ